LIQLSIDKQRAPQKGDLLLSEPFLLDDHFTRSVIFLCEHNEEGSFGFILNNTLDLRLHDFAEDFPDVNVTVGFGGPVDRNQLFFIHTIPNLEASIPISPDVYMGGNYAKVLELLQNEKITVNDIRFFIGYTGWGPEQLEEELEAKTWIVTRPPSTVPLMHASDDTLWKDILRAMGGNYSRMAGFPINPADN
jgi:putative transcriptional regulator